MIFHAWARPTESKDEILIQLKSVKTFYLQAYNFTSFPLELTLNSGLVGFREFGSFYRNVFAFNLAQIQNIASAVLKITEMPRNQSAVYYASKFNISNLKHVKKSG